MTVARLSDHIRVPHHPSFPDLAAITRTIDIADVAIAPATIVLNLALVNHPGADDARTVVETTVVVMTLSVSEALKLKASLRMIERATEDSS